MEPPCSVKRIIELLREAVRGLVKALAMLISLYFFICSLTFLSTAFRILGGKNLSSLFSSSRLLSNPVVGVMIGILLTVLVQSSATSTSIIVSLVSAGVSVRHAVPMIFGSNVGTSVTNTLVSLAQAGDRDKFRLAFAAATVHDMFNWLSVAALLAAEMATGWLEMVTGTIVDAMPLGETKMGASPDLLKPLTKPLTELVVKVDKEVLLGWSFNDPRYTNVTSLIVTDSFSLAGFLSEKLNFSDILIGVVLLVLSLLMLSGCLLALMKVLNSVLSKRMTELIESTVNAEVPGCPGLTGYLAMLVGAVITFLVRSSSVFTSTLTPLCGEGLVRLETAYPMTLGSNIGTTTTALLASLAAEGRYLRPAVQIALVHLGFNLTGILLFYPLPFMRWPLPLARALGALTARYRWFAILYLVLSFFVLPLGVFLLSLAGLAVMYSVLGAAMVALAFVLIVNKIQETKPKILPKFLRSWGYLPLWMRSLEPLDRLISRLGCWGNSCSDPEARVQHRVDVEAPEEIRALV